jgi:ADP-dependent NAD(P)H-hydrate dehydratase / NAD(P)H-hydrate epimerase
MLQSGQSSGQSISRFAVTAEQMTQIEFRIFAAGMPVAALMEKVAGLLAHRIQSLYDRHHKIGILVGPGHNGGDALVVARELHLSGYSVQLYQPFDRLKDLTAQHSRYADSLGIPTVSEIAQLDDCDLILDGLFGFGLTRPLEGAIAQAIHHLNTIPRPILSIDLPSGLHTDTGAVLGTALRASHTFCLGLWKQAFLQDVALEYFGQSELIEFGIPLADIRAVLGEVPQLQRIEPQAAIASLPHRRSLTTHKYEQGHLLLVCGSRPYFGAAILAASAARASGVGMLSIAVPDSLRLTLVSHIPDALVIGCPEGAAGEIADLPPEITLETLEKYDAIACGCGLSPQAHAVVQKVLASQRPLILDADGLNILAKLMAKLVALNFPQRSAPTILTPHPGEFKRLFPALIPSLENRLLAVQQAAQQSGMVVLLKGARTAIAHPNGQVQVIADSTPALARGGSGDVLTGLMGGLLAAGMRQGTAVEAIVANAAAWHAQAGIFASRRRTELGVDASTLVQSLIPALQESIFP